jgi:hypothetical protein
MSAYAGVTEECTVCVCVCLCVRYKVLNTMTTKFSPKFSIHQPMHFLLILENSKTYIKTYINAPTFRPTTIIRELIPEPG